MRAAATAHDYHQPISLARDDLLTWKIGKRERAFLNARPLIGGAEACLIR